MRANKLMLDVGVQTEGGRGWVGGGDGVMLMLRRASAHQQTAPPCGQKGEAEGEKEGSDLGQ